MRETLGASYYRARPLEAVKYAKSKFDLRGRACSADAILAGLGLDVLRSRRGLEHWAEDLDDMLRSTTEISRSGDEQGSVSVEGALLQYGVVRCLEPVQEIDHDAQRHADRKRQPPQVRPRLQRS